MTVDRPLTVHKRRGARGSVLDGSFGEPSPETSSDGSTIYDLIKKNAGMFLHKDAIYQWD